jgi:ligand-binding SRPBCC domain-containing protein
VRVTDTQFAIFCLILLCKNRTIKTKSAKKSFIWHKQMIEITLKTLVNCHFEKVRDGFDQKLLETLNPPGISLKIEQFDGIYAGAGMRMRVVSLFSSTLWTGKILQVCSKKQFWCFVAEGHILPTGLACWRHVHAVVKKNNHTMIYDRVYYSGKNRFFTLCWYPAILFMLTIRKPRYRKYFENL